MIEGAGTLALKLAGAGLVGFQLVRVYLMAAGSKYEPDSIHSPMEIFARMPLKARALMAVVAIADMLIGWHIAYPLIDWMPPEWGGLNEDGEWEQTRWAGRATLGFAIGIALLSFEDVIDKLRVRQKALEEALKESRANEKPKSLHYESRR